MMTMFLLVATLIVATTSAIEPISIGVGLAFLSSLVWYDNSPCRLIECCKDHSIIANFSGLESVLRERVYGQHLTQDLVVNALRAHFEAKSPSKALALSFHGTPGSGKNFVTKFIAEAIFKRGMRSSHFRQYTGGIDFPDDRNVEIYKMDLQKEIMDIVRSCERSMIVFDDVQKLPAKLLDAIKPFLDHHDNVQRVDFRKTVFIFLSNTGAGSIANKYLELWKEGKQREDIQIGDFESLIRAGALNEEGGFYMNENIASNLIDFYVPFLPLEEKHVKMCITWEFQHWGYHSAPEDAIKTIIKDLVFIPKNEKLFSSSGCKRINSRVGAIVQGMRYDL